MIRIVLLLCALGLHNASAQTDSTIRRWTPNYPPQEAPPSWWYTFGYGGAAPQYLSVLTSIAWEAKKHHLLTARITGGFGDAAGKIPTESTFDFAALYGYSNDNILWFINISAGLSCVVYNDRVFQYTDDSTPFPKDIYKIKSHVIPGIPCQLQVFSRFSKTSGAGLGFNIGGNFNKVQNTGFLTLSLIVGAFD